MLKFATSDAPVTMAEAWPVVFAPDRYIRKDAFADQVRLRGEGGLKAVLADRELAVTAGQGPGAVRSLVELARLLDRMGSAKTAAAALDRFVADVDVDEQLRARLRSEKEQDLAIAAFHAVHALLRGLGVAPADAAAALEALDVRGGRPPEQCVWVSTIHKAKGLEWRTVLLPELSEGACPAVQRGSVPGTVDEPAGVPQSPWIEQERRIFYVGLTRAVDQVLLHAPDATRSRFVTEAEGLAEPKKAAAGGAPWTAADDMLLRAGWARGDALTKLQERLGRSASAVAARLVRLRLVDSRAEARKRG
jgi:DNA helicase-2/ATP-dependent DNA helicase PcrA